MGTISTDTHYQRDKVYILFYDDLAYVADEEHYDFINNCRYKEVLAQEAKAIDVVQAAQQALSGSKVARMLLDLRAQIDSGAEVVYPANGQDVDPRIRYTINEPGFENSFIHVTQRTNKQGL